MKKKVFAILTMLLMVASANAQFQEGKPYASASLSGFDLNFNSKQKWNADLSAKAGYLFERDWMVTANVDYSYRHYGNNSFGAGAGLRYYIEQNGLYIGAGANYVHQHNYDDFMPTVQLGYAYFISRTVTIEPELYYNQSLKSHSDYSGFGFRIGFGIYLE